ncbi:MAG TPA: zincin-like metallopeptidase domain-containing protein [Fimbriimonadaceae bacterium]|nr:zincin-like metallopeptidase domain-containing protein [Fimbriimonadaceae bacterium]
MSRLYETVTEKIVESLKRGVVPWRKPWKDAHALPINVASGKVYRGINVFLLGLTPYADHRWLTFKQVQERGGKVRQGEKGTLVVFWKQLEFEEIDESTGEVSKRRTPMLRYFTVFNVEQIEGIDFASPYTGEPLDESQRIERAELLARSMPNPPAIHGKARSAYYVPKEDAVYMPAFERFASADHYYGTLFHELAHASGHESRLNRKGVTEVVRFGSNDYSREELVAELTSAFCCATVGLDNSLTEDSASYISGWLDVLGDDPKAVVIAAAQAQKAADYIRGVTYDSS